MSIYAGIFNTTQNPAELNARSFAGTILRRRPNGSAPLFGMTAMTGDSKAKASTHGYFSKTMVFSQAVMAATALVGDTALTVASTAGLVKGMVLQNLRTNETVRILAVTSATVLTVTRQFGRIAAAAVNNGDVWIAIGNAHEEGSPRPAARSIQAVYVPNFTQIWRNAWALTDTARASYAEQGYSNISESKRDCMDFHSIDIESSLFWGQPYMSTVNGQPIHATQGIVDAIRQYAPTNVDAAPAETSYDDIVDMLLPCWKYATDVGDPTTRVAFCDTTAMRVMQDIGKEYGEVSLTQKETSYGMKFSEFRYFKGSLMLKEHPLFNGIGVTPGTMVIVDVPAVKMAYMDGRKTISESYQPSSGGSNEMGNGVDAQGGSITTEAAVELINPAGCGVITNLIKAKPRVHYTKEVI